MDPASYEELDTITSKAVDIFAGHNLRSCLIGSAASSLWGITRVPNDIDLVVFVEDGEYDQEDLKDLLTDGDDGFYTVRSRNPNAAHRVLWYALPTPEDEEEERRCKVDILIPGILSIPAVPPGALMHIKDMPVMPLIPLILLKLRGWIDHRDSDRWDYQAKQHVDVDDIDELLEIACEAQVRLTPEQEAWLPKEFLEEGQERVEAYIEEFSTSTLYWQNIGYPFLWSDRDTAI